jgi:hypothetical protein
VSNRFWALWLAALVTLSGGVAGARVCLDYGSYGGPNGAPPLVGGLPLISDALDLAVQAGHAYVVCGEAGLQIVELSDPANPVWVGEADLLGNAVTIAASGPNAFVGVGSAIKVVDITMADNPQWTQTFGAGNLVHHIIVSGDLILAAADSSGLVVIDGAVEPLLSSVATVTTQAPARAVAASVDGTTAWIASDAGVEIIALDGVSLELTGRLVLGHTAVSLVTDGDLLWIATDDGLLLACDVSDPLQPQELRRHTLPSPAVSLFVSSGFLYQGGADGLTRVAGVGSRGTLVIMGSIPASGMTQSVTGVGPYLYFANGEAGLQVAWQQCDLVTVVGTLTPTRSRLVGAVPNPLGPGSSIVYRLGESTNARLSIHDARGREVAVLVDEQHQAGPHQIQWDGYLGDGRRAPAGVWFVRMNAGGKLDTKNVVVMR